LLPETVDIRPYEAGCSGNGEKLIFTEEHLTALGASDLAASVFFKHGYYHPYKWWSEEKKSG
jgi:hypothetical protein